MTIAVFFPLFIATFQCKLNPGLSESAKLNGAENFLLLCGKIVIIYTKNIRANKVQ